MLPAGEAPTCLLLVIMQIIDNKALLLRVRNPTRITQVIPKSHRVSENEVLVRWDVDEAQVLKNLGIKNVPSPITANYGWPGTYKPFEHQKITAEFLTLNRRAFCFSEQGTAKTASVIWAADYLMRKKKIRRVLIICPLSIMNSVWLAEIFRIAMHRTAVIAHSYSREKRREAIDSDAEFVIVNYDGVEIVQDRILDCADFDLVVLDEANAVKSVSTNRWKVINKIIQPHTWCWMLTGTPASQEPTDAYGLAKMMNPSSVPKFFGAFRDMVMQKITMFKWIPKPNAIEVVHRVLQPAIRYTKAECLDLPDMTYVTREVPMTRQQEKYYEQMRQQMLTIAAGQEISAVNAAANLNKLLQISCGAAYTDTREVVEFDCSSRMHVLKEVIDEASHKVLVFANFTHSIDLVSEELKKAGYTCDVVDGRVSAGKRTAIFKAFQETSTPRILVIQPQAASHGVTLHAANVVVWWGPIASFEIYCQANARVHRAGQMNRCSVVHLQGSPVERRIYQKLTQKDGNHINLMDLYAAELKESVDIRAHC